MPHTQWCQKKLRRQPAAPSQLHPSERPFYPEGHGRMCDGPASPCGSGQRLRCARPWCSHFKISASFFIAARACMARLRACFRQTAAHSANALWFASPGCDPWGATGISRSDRFQPPRLHPCCRKFIGQGVPPFPSAGVHRGRAAWPPIHPVVESDVMDGQGATPAAVSQVRHPGSGSCTLGLWRTQRVWVRTLRRLAHISVACVSSRCGQASLTTLHAAVHHIALSC